MGDLENSAAELIRDAPSRDTLRENFGRVDQYLPPDFPNPDELSRDELQEYAVQWTEEAIVRYAESEGIPTDEESVRRIASSLSREELGVDVTELPANEKQLASFAIDAAATGFTYYTGVDPGLARVTVESLTDGKLSEDELESIGAVGGAVAGAAIGQAFGIPAPIGAWLGGQFGGMIGGTVAQIFGLDTSAGEQLRALVEAKLEAQQAWRDEAQELYSRLQTDYQTSLEIYILTLAERWTQAEEEGGFAIDELRWFGRGASGELHREAPGVGEFNCRWYTTHSSQGAVQSRECGYECLEDMGCPYPLDHIPTSEQVTGLIEDASSARTFKAPESPLVMGLDAGAVTPPGMVAGYAYAPGIGLRRAIQLVCSAFATRKAVWTPPASRTMMVLSNPSEQTARYPQHETQWVGGIQRSLDMARGKLQSLETINVRVTGDLIRTATVFGAEHTVLGPEAARPDMRDVSAVVPVIVGAGAVGVGMLALKGTKLLR